LNYTLKISLFLAGAPFFCICFNVSEKSLETEIFLEIFKNNCRKRNVGDEKKYIFKKSSQNLSFFNVKTRYVSHKDLFDAQEYT